LKGKIMRKLIVSTLAGATALFAISVATQAISAPTKYDIIVSNIPALGSTKFNTLYLNSSIWQWMAGNVTLNASAPSTQKTIGASKNRQSIMYKTTDGNTVLVDGSIGYGMGAWSANFDADPQAIFTDATQTNLFKLVPEEIEVEPTTNDVFALVSGIGMNGPKQIYRIKTTTDGTIATAMTFHTSVGVQTPNGNRAFINPFTNGYKAGSIAFVPNPNGGQYLVFTSQSTVYQGICHWVYVVKSGAEENQLWAATTNGLPNGPSMSKCQKSSGPGSFPGFGAAVGGINTTYIGPRQMGAGAGYPAPGKFLISRDNGDVYEVKGLFDFGGPPSPWSADKLTNNPTITNTSLSTGSDMAWVRNYE
jgi:hypothetical protein